MTVSNIDWTGLTGQKYFAVAKGVLASLGSSLIFSGSDARLVPRRERHPLEGELMARIVGDFP